MSYRVRTAKNGIELRLHELEAAIGFSFAFAEVPPARCWLRRSLPAFTTALALWVLPLLLPHQTGTAALDVLHARAEQTLTFFTR